MFGVEPLDGQLGDVAVLRKDPGRGWLEFACRAEKEHQEFRSSGLLKKQRSLRTRRVSAADQANPKAYECTTARMARQPTERVAERPDGGLRGHSEDGWSAIILISHPGVKLGIRSAGAIEMNQPKQVP